VATITRHALLEQLCIVISRFYLTGLYLYLSSVLLLLYLLQLGGWSFLDQMGLYFGNKSFFDEKFLILSGFFSFTFLSQKMFVASWLEFDSFWLIHRFLARRIHFAKWVSLSIYLWLGGIRDIFATLLSIGRIFYQCVMFLTEFASHIIKYTKGIVPALVNLIVTPL
jgi:hypothetical protein